MSDPLPPVFDAEVATGDADVASEDVSDDETADVMEVFDACMRALGGQAGDAPEGIREILQTPNEAYEVVAGAYSELGSLANPRDVRRYFADLIEVAGDDEGTEVARVGAVFASGGFREPRLITRTNAELMAIGPKRKKGLVKCPRPKCGSMDTESMEKQTRAGDEGMTVFSVCFTCGFNWRVNS